MKRELALPRGSSVVFKLLGPVLVKQELREAQAAVGEKARPQPRDPRVAEPQRKPLLSCSSSSGRLWQQRQGPQGTATPWCVWGGGVRQIQGLP